MPRNTRTYSYITLSFPHELEAWQSLQEEARQRNLSVQRYIKLILVERYQAQHGMPMAAKSMQTSHKEQVSREVEQKAGTAPSILASEHRTDAGIVTQNAAAAAAFWKEET